MHNFNLGLLWEAGVEEEVRNVEEEVTRHLRDLQMMSRWTQLRTQPINNGKEP